MDTNCFNQDNSQLDPEVFAILRYNDGVALPNTTAWDPTMAVICLDLNLADLVPLNPLPVPEPHTFIRIDISFQTRAADLNYGFLNNTSWIPLNGSNILDQTATKAGNYSVTGVDSTDFSIANQLVYSLPTIQTVEYAPSLI
jgi:hypothetical protein